MRFSAARTLDWMELVPASVAVEQAAWERERLVDRVSRAGATFAQIGARLGVSTAHAQKLGVRARRRVELELPSPVEQWLGEDRDLRALAGLTLQHKARRGHKAHPEKVLRLRDEGMTFAAIGRALGVSTVAVYKAWHRARHRVERV